MKKIVLMTVLFLAVVTSGFSLTLGKFDFNDIQFGDTLLESDGGDWLLGNWLNVVNANPGNPGALTGANVDTGIANIGNFGIPPTYVIGYNTPIANNSGTDLGIISADFGGAPATFSLAVSTDGVNFTSFLDFGPELGVNTGVMREYFYAPGSRPFSATLFVTPVDLSVFGLGSGASIKAVEITSATEGDLIRVAGTVPEPNTTILIAAGLVALSIFVRKRL